MRIIFVNTSRIWGGNEKWTFEAIKGLRSRGNEVALICGRSLLEKRARGLGIQVVRMRMRSDIDLISLFRLTVFFRTWKPRSVVLTRGREYWLGGIAARMARIPFIVARIGIEREVRRSLKDRLIFGFLLDKIIVNSSSIRSSLLSGGAIPADKVAVIYNGVRTDPPDEKARQRIRESLGVQKNELLIGTAGRLIHRKGVDILLDAGKRLMLKDKSVKLVFLGDGPLREDILAASREECFSGRIIVTGFIEGIEEYLASLDMFVLPSRAEGISNALLEAMGLGIPSIAARAGGQEEAIADGETGFLVGKEDVSSLCERLLELTSKPDKRSTMGKLARHFVGERFPMDVMLEKLESLLAGGEKG
ncbi:MAG: glycosyltransferase [Candidatus Eisenbacteria bacterium]|nr:glycosyltransferase [Candidatus Eisenbacteria bacterium]